MSNVDLRSKKSWGALAIIAAIVGAIASAFAWTAGWIGSRTTSQALVSETPTPFPPGDMPVNRQSHACKTVAVSQMFPGMALPPPLSERPAG